LRALQLRKTVTMLQSVGNPGHDIGTDADLPVRYGQGIEQCSRPEIGQVSGHGGRADVQGDAEGQGGRIPALDGNNTVLKCDCRHLKVMLSQQFRQSSDHPRCHGDIAGQGLPEAFPIRCLIVQ
jgi:hypothetical protein